jgi:hypothetical protein
MDQREEATTRVYLSSIGKDKARVFIPRRRNVGRAAKDRTI